MFPETLAEVRRRSAKLRWWEWVLVIIFLPLYAVLLPIAGFFAGAVYAGEALHKLMEDG